MISERTGTLRLRLLSSAAVQGLISNRAYELYERRGGQPGQDVEDWLAAESEILQLAPLVESALLDTMQSPPAPDSE